MTEAVKHRVWAPHASRVEAELVATGARVPLVAEGHGVFTLAREVLCTPYWLRLDGGERVLDPRAEDVETVLGPGQLVNHRRFSWTDGAFRPPDWSGAVLHELHVGTFTKEGTFDAAAAKLERLLELGVSHVELMPVATFSGLRGWGYDGAAMFAPHRAYGGVEGLKRFVDRAHRLGLAVVLDVVLNHVGPIGNFLGRFGPFFHDGRHTPWGAAVNFDGPGSDEVRRFFLDAALHWVRDFHVDGLRLDATHAIEDRSATHLLEQLAEEAKGVGRPVVLIAESDANDPRVFRSPRQGGFGLHASWCDDFHHALHVALTGEAHGFYADFHPQPLRHVARALEQGFVLQGQYSAFRQRRHGRPLGEVPLDRLVAFAQNHDQVGNRAHGERLVTLVGDARARIALALTLLGPFTPLLFQGEAWGAPEPFQYFTDHQDPEVAKAVSAGRRREHGGAEMPEPQALSTFERSVLDWGRLEQPRHLELWRFTQALIALRKRFAKSLELVVGCATADDAKGTLVYARGPLLLVVNLGGNQTVDLPHGHWRPAFSTGAVALEGAAHVPGNGLAVLLDSDRLQG